MDDMKKVQGLSQPWTKARCQKQSLPDANGGQNKTC